MPTFKPTFPRIPNHYARNAAVCYARAAWESGGYWSDWRRLVRYWAKGAAANAKAARNSGYFYLHG